MVLVIGSPSPPIFKGKDMYQRISLIAFTVSLFIVGYWCAEATQERAKLKYFNPKFIQDVVVFTGRKSRHDPYLTNMTGTTLMPYGNNVTFATALILKSGGDFRFVAKVCETMRYKWMNEFMSSFTNLTLDKCPFPAGRYTYINMRLPPKNIPLPLLANGDYWSMFELYITTTKEKILEVETLLHFDNNSKKSSKKPQKG